MIIAQISDLHIRPAGRLLYDHVDTNGLCARHVAFLNSMPQRPDVVVITGDITNCGLPEEYEMAAAILRQLDYPTFIIPGNHDNNKNMIRGLAHIFPVLGDTPERICYAVDDYEIRMIFVDSSVEGLVSGKIGSLRLEWLAETLNSEKEKQTIIFTHHHPVPSGCAHMDTLCCADGHRLLALLKDNPQVSRLFCGHTHRTIIQSHGNLMICTAPATAHQVPYDRVDTKGFYSLEPPAMLMHSYSRDIGMVSWFCSLSVFDGPFRFETTCGCPEYSSLDSEV